MKNIFKGYYQLDEEHFYEVAIIFVVLNEEAITEVEHRIQRKMPDVQGNLRIVIGKAEYSEEEGHVYGFSPSTDFQLGRDI